MDWQTPEDTVPSAFVTEANARSLLGEAAGHRCLARRRPAGRPPVRRDRRARARARRRAALASRIAYETWGKLNADRRQRRARAARPHRRQPRRRRRRARASDRRLVDRPRRRRQGARHRPTWFVVAPNMLGGCQGIDRTRLARARRPRVGFPLPVPHDPRPGRRAARRSPTRSASTLGRRRSAVRWAACRRSSGRSRHPDRVERVAVLAAPPRSRAPTRSRSTRCSSRRSASIPAFADGDYYDAADGDGPHRGLALARRMALLNYRSPTELNDRFERSWQSGVSPLGGGGRVRGRELPRLPRQQVHAPLRRQQLHHARRAR